ncbi:MAG: hypothetical protein HN976_34385, partial [Lentisphaerae bacterium]|nr:hypothetical protein [Lentisphaerota bacterium]
MKMTISLLFAATFIAATAAGQGARIQPRDPHLGYIYPAGAQRGATLVITAGGQHLENVDGLYCSG